MKHVHAYTYIQLNIQHTLNAEHSSGRLGTTERVPVTWKYPYVSQKCIPFPRELVGRKLVLHFAFLIIEKVTSDNLTGEVHYICMLILVRYPLQ